MSAPRTAARGADTRAEREISWPLHLLQAPPLIIAALLAAVWFAVPGEVRGSRLDLGMWGTVPATTSEHGAQSVPAPDVEKTVLTAFSLLELTSRGRSETAVEQDPQSQLRDRVDTLGTVVAPLLLTDQRGSLVNPSGPYAPLGYPTQSQAMDAIRNFEDEMGAHVLIWLAPLARSAPVVASAITAPQLLTSPERHELETSRTLDTLRAALSVDGPRAIPFDTLNSGATSPGGKRTTYMTTSVINGRFYELYGLFPPSNSGPAMPDTIGLRTATDAAFTGSMRLNAANQHGDIFLVGPVDSPPVPVLADQLKRSEASSLIAAFWPGLAPAVLESGNPVALGAAESRLAGGAQWALFKAVVGMPRVGAAATKPPGLVPESLVIAALFDGDPELAFLRAAVVTSRWRAMQVFLAVWMPVLLGSLGLLFLASLIASLLAFAAERTLRADRDIESERERVRREARSRVLDRLTGLSARVDGVASEVARRNAEELVAVSRDIVTTVSDLRGILGDERIEGGTPNA